MANDQRAIQLQQLASIVIDAYLSRNEQFVPNFDPSTNSVMYLCRPQAAGDDPKLELNFWYERANYEPGNRS